MKEDNSSVLAVTDCLYPLSLFLECPFPTVKKKKNLYFLPDIPVIKLQHILVTSEYCLLRTYLELGCPSLILKEIHPLKHVQATYTFTELMRKCELVQKTAGEHAQELYCKDYTYLVTLHTHKSSS